ncbi:MAG: hypothetical protein M1818_001304 [Claussenomyces sp. TS43310]|nr:MAG: hypothetical protein M1818_001304 [Claussenomyces sp. TS43310]
MAPIRRYLRITKYSVLEVRIFLDNPSLAQTWLLNPRAPILPRVIEAVRPLVLPKLREERERQRSKTKKKKQVKDVVTQEDFEVSIFLTGTTTRHSLLTKHKHFRDKAPLASNSSKLTGTNAIPIEVDDGPIANLRREDSEEPVDLNDIPAAAEDSDSDAFETRPRKRRKGSDDGLFVQDDDEGSDAEEDAAASASPTRTTGADDDKKKMAMDTTYDGFAIYGQVLYLVIKKRDVAPKHAGQAIMEDWIVSTQTPGGE